MSYFIQIWKSYSAQADDGWALLFNRIWLVAGIGLVLIATMAWTALLGVRALRADSEAGKDAHRHQDGHNDAKAVFLRGPASSGKVASGPVVGLAKAMIELRRT